MKHLNLLLLSSSRVGETNYLTHALSMIENKLNGVSEVLFIPFAGVTMTYDQYTEKVQSAFSHINVTVKGIHEFDDAQLAIKQAQAIVVGGGNTFHLLYQLQKQKLIPLIQTRCKQGIPYIGWSAGSNIAGLSIRTTNDMPIIEPESFNALQLVDFQLNPHYTDHNPPGHNGETRAQRLAEFMVLNPETAIVGIVEGSALNIENNQITLIGDNDQYQGYLFKAGQKTTVAINESIVFKK